MGKTAQKASRRPWQPMERGETNPAYVHAHYPDGLPEHVVRVEAWGNDVYQATIEHYEDGSAYITFKRHDRVAAHDWRHIQAIKNDVVGREREAVELYPAESRLMDTANQYHLWVAPEGVRFPFGSPIRALNTPAEIRALNEQHPLGGKARQRAWQPGITTGPATEGEIT